VPIFTLIDELLEKFDFSRSNLFKRTHKEDWHSKRLLFQKKLAAEISKQATGSSFNEA
tara:strand:- start:206 stop:379 length:174 start_codon:yes stop_codon:yes gene_type:complete